MLKIGDHVPADIRDLITRLTAFSPLQRPCFNEVRRLLQQTSDVGAGAGAS